MAMFKWSRCGALTRPGLCMSVTCAAMYGQILMDDSCVESFKGICVAHDRMMCVISLTLATSTLKAEYVAAAWAAKEGLWLLKLTHIYG
jgi:hypothetical protein